jgi:lipid-binding SYLF domain-containing protein
MRRLIAVALAVGSIASIPLPFEEQLLHQATAVLAHVLDAPRPAIPQSVLARARAVLVMPGVKGDRPADDRSLNATGVLSARGATPEHWSPPAIVGLRGAIAAKFDVDNFDIVVIAQTGRGFDALIAERQWLPGSVTIAPGPVNEGAAIDADLVAYALFENYFGGIAIDEWTVESSKDANAVLYGKGYSTESVVRGLGFFQLRPAARAWRNTLAVLFGQMS